MWIFLNDAFISIVRPRNEGAYDPDRYLMIRARIQGDLERLFPGVTVFENKGTDYRFRCFVEKEHVAQLIAEDITKISYTNFKDGVRDKARHDCYMSVWTVMFREQESRRPRRKRTKKDKQLSQAADRWGIGARGDGMPHGGVDNVHWDYATQSWKIGKQPPFRLVKK